VVFLGGVSGGAPKTDFPGSSARRAKRGHHLENTFRTCSIPRASASISSVVV